MAKNLSLPDNFSSLIFYFDYHICGIQERASKPKAENELPYDLKPNRVDRSMEEAESLMSCLGNGYPGLRGPYLAKLEICYRMKVNRMKFKTVW